MIYGRDNMEHDRIKQWLEDVYIHDFIEERLENNATNFTNGTK